MSLEQDIENEHDLWRWYTQVYLIDIIEPPNGFGLILEKLKGSDLGNIVKNVKKIFMPKKLNFEVPYKTPETILGQQGHPPSANTPANQAGGGLFCQKDYKIDVYFNYRLNAYDELLSYLNENNVRVELLTKNLLKKLYLYHYSIGYVKALNYILFKIQGHKLPTKLQYILSNVFQQISNEIYNDMMI
jgi:hypothetical protein